MTDDSTKPKVGRTSVLSELTELETALAQVASKATSVEVRKELRSINSSLKKTKRRVGKVAKSPRKRTSNGNSGLKMEVPISSAMKKFLKTKGKTASRTHATSIICAYIREKNLNGKVDGKSMVLPDAKLAAILGSKDPCTYPEIQQKIKHHFSKKSDTK